MDETCFPPLGMLCLMPPENPYAAPQSLDTRASWTKPGGGLGDNGWSGDAVAAGARLCLLAVWLTVACVVVVLSGVLVLKMFLLSGLLIMGLLVAAAICHGMGIVSLLKIEPSAGVSGLLTVSLTTFVLAVLGNVGEHLLQLDGHGEEGLVFSLLQEVLSLVTYGTLTLALVRIARFQGNDRAGVCQDCADDLGPDVWPGHHVLRAVALPAGPRLARTSPHAGGREVGLDVLDFIYRHRHHRRGVLCEGAVAAAQTNDGLR